MISVKNKSTYMSFYGQIEADCKKEDGKDTFQCKMKASAYPDGSFDSSNYHVRRRFEGIHEIDHRSRGQSIGSSRGDSTYLKVNGFPAYCVLGEVKEGRKTLLCGNDLGDLKETIWNEMEREDVEWIKT